MKVVELLKAIGDETRIRIINIVNQGEHCVCDIEAILDLSQSNASRHLNKLKSLNIINAEKKAPWVYYTLNLKTVNQYKFINDLIKLNLDNDIFKEDLIKREIYLKNKKSCNLDLK